MNITEQDIRKRREQHNKKVLQKFNAMLTAAICDAPEMESVPQDILIAISGMREDWEVWNYLLNTNHRLNSKETLKGAHLKSAYQYWFIEFIKCQLTANGYGNRKLMAGYLIKQLGKGRMDRYHTLAHLQVLQDIYALGRLGAELKESCQCVFSEYKAQEPEYGQIFSKNIIS